MNDIHGRFRSFIFLLPLFLTLVFTLISCGDSKPDGRETAVIDNVGYPSAIYHDGMYYLTVQNDSSDVITLFASPKLADIGKGQKKVILDGRTSKVRTFYSPDINFFDGKWYIYFEGDDGYSTDNHQIFVLENASENPLEGEWTLHGPVITNSEWNFSIHPSTFTCGGRLYMLWSGWQKRRVESETQCIFIAEMENPYTLKSERVMLSLPEYEWERQWINSDGMRSAYPIFVNENPQGVLSPDGRNVIIFYSASGIWTEFTSLGMLYAPATANLLDPRSWTKLPEPQFTPAPETPDKRSSNVSVVNNQDEGKSYFVYETRIRDNGSFRRGLNIAELQWDDNSMPVLGHP